MNRTPKSARRNPSRGEQDSVSNIVWHADWVLMNPSGMIPNWSGMPTSSKWPKASWKGERRCFIFECCCLILIIQCMFCVNFLIDHDTSSVRFGCEQDWIALRERIIMTPSQMMRSGDFTWNVCLSRWQDLLWPFIFCWNNFCYARVTSYQNSNYVDHVSPTPTNTKASHKCRRRITRTWNNGTGR